MRNIGIRPIENIKIELFRLNYCTCKAYILTSYIVLYFFYRYPCVLLLLIMFYSFGPTSVFSSNKRINAPAREFIFYCKNVFRRACLIFLRPLFHDPGVSIFSNERRKKNYYIHISYTYIYIKIINVLHLKINDSEYNMPYNCK